jgi:hypothetical protein
MKERWSVQEIVASLEAQAAFHRERQAHHAEQEALHQERRSHHTAELDAISRRLQAFQTAAAEAVQLAGRPAKTVEPETEDFGPASNPKLTRMVRKILDDLGPQEPFGPNGVTAELHRRFGPVLRTLPDLRQISDILRRLSRAGHIHRLRGGRPHHESRYTREAPAG